MSITQTTSPSVESELNNEVKLRIRDIAHAVQLEGVVREELVNLEAVNAARAGAGAVRAALLAGEASISDLVADVSTLKTLHETLTHPFPLPAGAPIVGAPNLFPGILPPEISQIVFGFVDVQSKYFARCLSHAWYRSAAASFEVPRFSSRTEELTDVYEGELKRLRCDDLKAGLLLRVSEEVRAMRADVAPLVGELKRVRQLSSGSYDAPLDRNAVSQVRAVGQAKTQLILRKNLLQYRVNRLKAFLQIPSRGKTPCSASHVDPTVAESAEES